MVKVGGAEPTRWITSTRPVTSVARPSVRLLQGGGQRRHATGRVQGHLRRLAPMYKAGRTAPTRPVTNSIPDTSDVLPMCSSKRRCGADNSSYEFTVSYVGRTAAVWEVGQSRQPGGRVHDSIRRLTHRVMLRAEVAVAVPSTHSPRLHCPSSSSALFRSLSSLHLRANKNPPTTEAAVAEGQTECCHPAVPGTGRRWASVLAWTAAWVPVAAGRSCRSPRR
jgi:hypothetical protein